MTNEPHPDQPVAPMTPPSGSGSSGIGSGRMTPLSPSLPQEDLSHDPFLVQLKRDDQGRPILGRIPLHRRIGRGGMGAVYYGIHPRLQIEVAVKVLPFHLIDLDPKFVERFAAEARLAASISSEHIARVLDVDQDSTTYYLVMEYVAGESAGAFLKRRKAEGRTALDEAEALAVVTAATRGLAAAHDRGIIHRDIKPDNILIPQGHPGRAKLTDLGLARVSMEGQSLGTMSHIALGTPGFMAPEQIDDAKTAGPEADVFAMGATLYTLLTGQPPFAGEKLGTILRQTTDMAPAPLPDSISPVTRTVVTRCLAKDPQQRYPNGRALLQTLEMILAQSSSSTITTPPSLAGVTAPDRPRSLWWIPVTVGLALAGIATILVLTLGSSRPGPNKNEIRNLVQQAETMEKENDFDGALAMLNRALALDPNDATVKATKARVAEKAKVARSTGDAGTRYAQFREAAEALTEAALIVNTSEAWRKVVLAWSKVEPNTQTQDERTMVQKMSRQAQQRLDWAAAREVEAAGDLEEALNLVDKAITVQKPPADLLKYKETLTKKLQLSKTDRRKTLQTLMAQAKAEKDPAKALDLWKKALPLANEEDDMDTIQMNIVTLEKKLSKTSGSSKRKAEEHFKEGQSRYDREDYNGAIEAYTKAIVLDSRHADALIGRAQAYQGLGDLKQALKDCDQALEIRPEDPTFFAVRASIYYYNTDLSLATRDLNRAIKLNPDYGWAYGLRGVLKRHQGDYHGSLSDLTRAIQLTMHTASEAADYYSKRAWTHWEFGHHAKAEEDFLMALKADPSRVETYNEVGWYYIRRGDYASAIGQADTALKIDKDSSNSYNVRGYAKLLSKNLAGSLADYDRMVQLAPREAAGHATRGYVLARLERFDEAEKSFQKARQFQRWAPSMFWTEYWSAAAEALKAKKLAGAYRMETLNRAMDKLEYAMKLPHLDGDCMCHAYQKDHLRDDPDFADLHKDTRFKQLAGTK